ncbi:MAG: branched-chain amino acid ABC transporter permease, partial [Lachnospiraceae bacterium]
GGITSNLINGQLVPICAYMIMAISLNLTVGILGELSLGHAGFMSVGAFSGVFVGTLMRQVTDSDLLCLIVAVVAGGLMAALAGFLIGIPVLRLKGDYLAIVTLAFGQIIKSIINILYVGLDSEGLHVSVINRMQLAEGGKMIISGSMGCSGVRKMSTFTFGFILLMLCLIVIFNLIQSRAGRAIMALRDNRIAAESVGINVTKYKLLVFSVSAAMAGMAGTLFAHNFSTVSPTKFDFNTSILVLVFVVLGGLGSMRGSLIAAALLTLLPELLREFSDYRMLVYAIVLILVMLGTNSPTVRDFFGKLSGKIKSLFLRKKTAKEENANG